MKNKKENNRKNEGIEIDIDDSTKENINNDIKYELSDSFFIDLKDNHEEKVTKGNEDSEDTKEIRDNEDTKEDKVIFTKPTNKKEKLKKMGNVSLTLLFLITFTVSSLILVLFTMNKVNDFLKDSQDIINELGISELEFKIEEGKLISDRYEISKDSSGGEYYILVDTSKSLGNDEYIINKNNILLDENKFTLIHKDLDNVLNINWGMFGSDFNNSDLGNIKELEIIELLLKNIPYILFLFYILLSIVVSSLISLVLFYVYKFRNINVRYSSIFYIAVFIGALILPMLIVSFNIYVCIVTLLIIVVLEYYTNKVKKDNIKE